MEPEWLDRTEYPFRPHVFDTAAGRLHYVDEGRGPPVLTLHGTPTWSFLYRHLIRGLSSDYRVIAPDHLGFGLSDKPERAPYRPVDHARRLSALIDALELDRLTLVVHDFGGPIGLSRAIEKPHRVRGLVLFNTWMWSLEDDTVKAVAGRLLGGRLGRLLYRRLNLSPRLLMKAAFGDRSKLTSAIHRHYLAPFPRAQDREAPWVLARELIGSSGWYRELWSRRDRIRETPALLLWGMKDPAFGPRCLERWRASLDAAEVVRFPEAGHFVQEEAGGRIVRPVRRFLARVHGRR